MADESLESEFEVVRRFKQLSDRYRAGYREQHPMSRQHREAAEKALREEWQKKQQNSQSQGKGNAQSRTQQQKMKQQQEEEERKNSQQKQSRRRSH